MEENIFHFSSKNAKKHGNKSPKHDDFVKEIRGMANRLDQIAETMEFKNWLRGLANELRKITKHVEDRRVKMQPAEKPKKSSKSEKVAEKRRAKLKVLSSKRKGKDGVR